MLQIISLGSSSPGIMYTLLASSFSIEDISGFRCWFGYILGNECPQISHIHKQHVSSLLLYCFSRRTLSQMARRVRVRRFYRGRVLWLSRLCPSRPNSEQSESFTASTVACRGIVVGYELSGKNCNSREFICCSMRTTLSPVGKPYPTKFWKVACAKVQRTRNYLFSKAAAACSPQRGGWKRLIIQRHMPPNFC